MRAFDDLSDHPCPVCLELAMEGGIQPRAVMPLPKFPGRLKQGNQQCCRDCQATDIIMVMGFQCPDFASARLMIANERLEGLTMPLGVMEHFGLCTKGWISPCSLNDLDQHIAWLESHQIPNSCRCVPFG